MGLSGRIRGRPLMLALLRLGRGSLGIDHVLESSPRADRMPPPEIESPTRSDRLARPSVSSERKPAIRLRAAVTSSSAGKASRPNCCRPSSGS